MRTCSILAFILILLRNTIRAGASTELRLSKPQNVSGVVSKPCINDLDCYLMCPSGVKETCYNSSIGSHCSCLQRRKRFTATKNVYRSLKYLLREAEKTLEKALEEDWGTGCDIPKTDPFAEEVIRFVQETTEIVCSGKDWVKCYLSRCKVDPIIFEKYKDIKCTYTDIIYERDNRYKYEPKRVLHSNETYELDKSDHIVINCEGYDNNHGGDLKKEWTGIAAGFRPVTVKAPPVGREKTYNVLMFGFDTASMNGFIRQMPRSYDYIKNVLNATYLTGYNVAGDATVASLFPIVTGKSELELPDFSLGTNAYLDTKYTIFHKLREDGYRTAFFEDVGSFQYRFNGFQRQPADHYLMDFYQEVGNFPSRRGIKFDKYCVGDTPQYQLMMNLTDQFFRLNGKKYLFCFLTEISHDNFDMISNADDSFVELLKGLLHRGVYKDTLLIVMGDHGVRYSQNLNVLQLKLETRLPLMAIRLPDDMVEERPDAQKALQLNTDVLTTPYDIYVTVLDTIKMKQYRNNYKIRGADLLRGLTLLEPITESRSCSEAGIEPHWCSCLIWENLKENHIMYKMAPRALVNHINELTRPVRSQCALRTLQSVEWVTRKRPNNDLLRYETISDDGWNNLLMSSNIPKMDVEYFQVRISVSPNNAFYEAVVKYNLRTRKLTVNTREISRTNAYGSEPECISKKYPQLLLFCYCISEHPILKLTSYERIKLLMSDKLHEGEGNTTHFAVNTQEEYDWDSTDI